MSSDSGPLAQFNSSFHSVVAHSSARQAMVEQHFDAWRRRNSVFYAGIAHAWIEASARSALVDGTAAS
jgi:hypothetical protein